MASRTDRRERVTRGTGNVFADLGFPDAAEREAKLRLTYALNQVLDARKLSQAEAAKLLGLTQPKVSALRHYKLTGFSVERLMNLLTALDQDVEIVIRQKPRARKVGQNQRRRSTRLADGSDTKDHPSAARIVHERQTPSARSNPQGARFQWTPPASRDARHDRAEDRGDVTDESRNS